MPPKKNNDDAFSDSIDTVRAYIKASGKDVNTIFSASDGKKHTMLYRACRLGRFEVAKMLVEDFGADVNLQNGGEDKSVPLHGACYGGSPLCVALLVQNGANVDAKNAHGETPLDNAKSPVDGVKKAFATKCQKLLKDSAACAAQLKAAACPSTAASVGSKTTASTAEACDEEKPATKMAKKEVTLPPIVPSEPHPFHGKTLVLSGTFKENKKACTARVTALGGKVTASVSGKTDYVINAKGASEDAGRLGALYGLPVWNEAEFDAMCKDGWSAVPPPKPVLPPLRRLAETTRLDERLKRNLISTLAWDFEHANPDDEKRRCLNFCKCVSVKDCSREIGTYGIDLVAPVITAWPGDTLNVASNELEDANVKSIMDAILARSDDVPLMRGLDIQMNNGVTNEGITTLADALPKTAIDDINLALCKGITKDGVTALLNAVTNSPSMRKLNLQHVSGAVEAVVEWRQRGGDREQCIICVHN